MARKPDLDTLLIERLAVRFEAHWQRVLAGRGSCQVGITVPPSWDPQDPLDPVLRTAEALLREGAMPHLLYLGAKSPEEQMHRIDALVVPGGEAIHPMFYGQRRPEHDPRINEAFDAFELTCLKLAFEMDMPFLGSSRGEQIMNVASGGTLIAVPESPVQHMAPFGGATDSQWLRQHEVETAENSRLEQIVGFDPLVNSVHEEAVDQLGRGLKATAWAPDAVVEGIERAEHPWQAAYQFHPEIDRRFQGLFSKLIQDALRHRKAS